VTSGAAPLALAAAALLAAADSHPPDVPAARPVAALRADHMVLDTALHESRVLAATQSGRVEVFDWKEGTALAPLLRLESASDRDYPPTVTSVDVSPGGGLIAAASSEGEIRILRFGSGAADEVRTLTARGVRVCRFLDDARLLVGDLRGEVALVELEGERERYRRQLEYDPVYALAIDPARRRVAVGFRSSRIQILDARSGETLQTLQGHRDSVYDLAWQGEHALLTSACSAGISPRSRPASGCSTGATTPSRRWPSTRPEPGSRRRSSARRSACWDCRVARSNAGSRGTRRRSRRSPSWATAAT
jgi:WD40 repeat protein